MENHEKVLLVIQENPAITKEGIAKQLPDIDEEELDWILLNMNMYGITRQDEKGYIRQP